MQNLSMCRMCLATDVRLCSITRSLQDMYEKLTELSFKREDRRPLVVCYICHARLQNCYRLRTSCLQSEELLTEMLTNDELVPHCVPITNTLGVVSVLHFSLGHVLQDSTECNVKEEAPEVIHDTELDQQNTEDIKMEPQEEHDTQRDEDIQYLHLEDSLDVMKREPDAVETDAGDIKLEIEDMAIKENMPNGSYQSSLAAYNTCPKIVKVVLERIALNYTRPASGVPAFKKLAETDSLLVTEPENVNKSIVVDNHFAISKIQKIDVKLQEHTPQSNICSIKKCFRSKAHLESHTHSKHDSTRHMYTHTGNGPYIIEICKKQFSRQSQSTVHFPIHTGEKRFQCDVCNKCFASKPILARHKYIHSKEKWVQCDMCNKSFSSKFNLTRHLFIHTGEKQFQCDTCNKCFMNKPSLTQHLNTHTSEKRFQCSLCNKCFKIKANASRHLYTHASEKRFQCDVCNKCFTSKRNLARHKYIHSREKRFECDMCNKYFTNKSNLTQHQYIHTGERRFQCEMCNKSFSSKFNLTQHLLIHTGEKRFKCDTCNKCFTYKSSLTKHISTHASEKRYQCDTCSKCFCNKANLKSHLNTHK